MSHVSPAQDAAQAAAARAAARMAQAAARRVDAAQVADAARLAARLAEEQRLEHVRNWHETARRRKLQRSRAANRRRRQLCESNTPEGIAARAKRDRQNRAAAAAAKLRKRRLCESNAPEGIAARREEDTSEGDTQEAVDLTTEARMPAQRLQS